MDSAAKRIDHTKKMFYRVSRFLSLRAGACANCAVLIFFAIAPASAVDRPPIVGIANFVVKTDNLEEVRKFYTGILGYDEVFKHKRLGTAGEVTVFKVNDRQYIEVGQTL